MTDSQAPHITEFISEQMGCARAMTRYREPLVGFVPTGEPGFRRLRENVTPAHYLPTDLSPGARAVVVIVLPFAPEVVEPNRIGSPSVASDWVLAHVDTNRLLGDISEGLVETPAAEGVVAVAAPPTHDSDPQSLSSRWSHKSIAMLAGLGRFGLHRMRSTGAGCLDRRSGVVMDPDVPVEPSPYQRGQCATGPCVTHSALG